MSAEAVREHFAAYPNVVRRAHEVIFSNGCWLWPSARYTKLRFDDKRVYLHRRSLELKLGHSLGSLEARHTCDIPRCFNPAHLTPGTHAENMRDMAERGRSGNAVRYGIANNKAQHTDEEICRFLAMVDAGYTCAEVARRAGVTRRAVATWYRGSARRDAHEMYMTRRDAA